MPSATCNDFLLVAARRGPNLFRVPMRSLSLEVVAPFFSYRDKLAGC
jgi:hypothetical protein